VANARKLRLIYSNKRKTDEIDAENLARLARVDPKLLYPLKHQSEDSQANMAIARSREALMSARLHLGSLWLRLGPKMPRGEDSLSGSQEHKEASGGGRGQEARGAFAQFVDERRGLRTTAQHPSLIWRPGNLKEEAKPK
jgi:hypothetical protein